MIEVHDRAGPESARNSSLTSSPGFSSSMASTSLWRCSTCARSSPNRMLRDQLTNGFQYATEAALRGLSSCHFGGLVNQMLQLCDVGQQQRAAPAHDKS